MNFRVVVVVLGEIFRVNNNFYLDLPKASYAPKDQGLKEED